MARPETNYGMSVEEVDRIRRDMCQRIDKNIEAEALAAEDAAVYNLDLIRKLEKRAARLEAEVLAHAKSITTLDKMFTAMCHDAEGEPEGHGLVEDVQ